MLCNAHYAHTRYEFHKINAILKKIQLHYVKPKLCLKNYDMKYIKQS